ncbi:cobaltochelatase subunit CobN [Allopusillimonas ginsengisoli]|nr:cobaltochelatase subunit CobN [Allopusillimonas ginsengisoli]
MAAPATASATTLAGTPAAVGATPEARTPVANPPMMLVLHNSFVSAEKFGLLQQFAVQHDVRLYDLNIEKVEPEVLRQALANTDLVLLDAPRPNDRAMLMQRLEQVERHEEASQLVVGGGAPSWKGLAPHYASALAALYAAGGEHNFQRFFQLFHAMQRGGAPQPHLMAPPRLLPATGFYHPKADQVFDSISAYLGWYAQHGSPQVLGQAVSTDRNTGIGGRGSANDLPASARRGRVAFLIHQGVITDMLTREVDQLVARSEAAGLLPIVFWQDASDPAGVAGALAKAGVDVLVNLTHMRNGSARTKDFLALDIPVIQTLRFGEGEAADWPTAVSGVPARTAAVFLAAPEGWGMSDPVVLSARTKGVEDLLPEQADMLIAKLKSLVALRHTPPARKKLALMFWNYPAGEKNMAASNLNVPRSIVSIQAALKHDGYHVGDALTEQQIIAAGQRMLGALHGSVSLDELETEGLAARYPLADYKRWLASLPSQRRAELQHGGDPARHWAVRERNGEQYFIIPRWQSGNLLIMPQMPRGPNPQAHYHDTAAAPDHLYMAAYLYLQNNYGSHALIHLGSHGTQEWLPGKDRGLAAIDYPFLAAGNIPVFYPYIQDNVGEAIQAKRRGRAVTVSHQTPPFAPAGLYDQLRDLHHLIHEYQQVDEGMVRERVRQQITHAAIQAHLHDDLGWTAQHIQQDFDGFLQQLHDHLHELARVATPLGLHTFGVPASLEHRVSTIMQQLGQPFYDALGTNSAELFADDYSELQRTPAYQAVQTMLATKAAVHLRPIGTPSDQSALKPFVERAKRLDHNLRNTQENDTLLAALAGRFVPPGAGGDPIRNPDIQSGRNLYAFEADKIPARAAYESGAKAYEQLLQAFRSEHHGAFPKKLAFSLWSSEAIRHLGVTEAQILHALGLRPVWDAGGRVTALDIIPATELGRPRVDVVVQVTGVYRDQFDSFMRLLADALDRLFRLNEPNNPIADHNRRIAATLQGSGLSHETAQAAASYRIFSNAPGAYGTGVPGLALQSTSWDDNAALARQFLSSSRYAYGSKGWGETLVQANLLAEQLRGAQAVIMSRSSSLHGVLSTDHSFEFMGGLSTAIRHLDGTAPQLLISDLRSNTIKTTGLARFLADELRARYLNPHWIAAMQQEGYAGTLQVLNVANNLFGWQVADPNTVRDDQWQALFDTYVMDTRQLGVREWFERHNPTAQAQVLERMAETIRKGYWNASNETRRALAERWLALENQFGVNTGAATTRQYIVDLAQGFGLSAAPAPAAEVVPHVIAEPQTPPKQGSRSQQERPAPRGAVKPDEPTEHVQGQVLEPVAAQQMQDYIPRYVLLVLMLLLCASGGAWQVWHNRHTGLNDAR